MSYVLVGKRPVRQGRLALVSYAQRPLWKTYEELLRQADTPAKLEQPEARRVLNKYGHKDTRELISYEEFEREFKAYIQTK